MTVYVETNFVLELALLQEQSSSCEEILAICRDARARLVVPSCALSEPYGTLNSRKSQRNRTREGLDQVLREMGRTRLYAQPVLDVQDRLAVLFIDSTEDELRRLREVRTVLLQMAEIIPMDDEVIRTAGEHEQRYELAPQDALVYASVRRHLDRHRPEASCFLNRNTKDFDDPQIVGDLAKLGCRMLPRFDHGLGLIRSVVSSS